MRDAKGKTRIMELNSMSIENAMTYVSKSRHQISQALGSPIMPYTPILIELRGGRYGK